MKIPPHARKLADDARSSGHEVHVQTEPEMVTVRITVDEGDTYTAAWWVYRGAWRYRHGTDGWAEHMTLTALRSFVVDR